MYVFCFIPVNHDKHLEQEAAAYLFVKGQIINIIGFIICTFSALKTNLSDISVASPAFLWYCLHNISFSILLVLTYLYL